MTPSLRYRLLFLWMAVAAMFSPLAGVKAAPLGIGKPLCHAIGDGAVPPDDQFVCTGEPSGYRDRVLWLRGNLSHQHFGPEGPVLLVHQTRFDRLIVMFRYADGTVDRQEVTRGNYADKWKIGGQIAFQAHSRGAAPVAVTIGLEHLASHELLRLRILSRNAANRDLALFAFLASGSLALLLIGMLSSLSLAIVTRRAYLGWQGLWIGCMFLWGLLWSEAELILWPTFAGTPAAKAGAVLGCVAFGAASISIALGLGRVVKRWTRRCMIILAVPIPLLGLAAALVQGRGIDLLGQISSILVLANLALWGLCIFKSWRRGSDEEVDLAISWTIPILIMGSVAVAEFFIELPGGLGQVAVLLATALQALWLSARASLRLASLQAELRKAQATETALTELASRDPLTGLLNRRGFIQCLEQIIASRAEEALGLMLMDVDLFKSINDRFGHETGDAVLCRIAAYLRRLEDQSCVCGRMGGEEFVVATCGLSSLALARFAERIRAELERVDHDEVSRYRTVTVSIGVAEGAPRTAFQKLYAAADRALYEAKRDGRNKVRLAAGMKDLELLEEMERDQLSFGWAALNGGGPQNG